MEAQEISLRELIEILLKNKAIIAVITIVCVFISGIFSFFVMDPVYEAQAKLIVSDLVSKQQSSEAPSIIDSLTPYPDFYIESYKEQIKNPEILSKTIEELQLDPEEYTISSLAKAITIDQTTGTNIIRVKVKNTDPELAAKIANSVAVNFTNFITDLSKKQGSKSLEYIENQLKIEEENLNKALLAYQEFLKQPRGVSELQSEQTSKIALLTLYKEELAQQDIEISATQKALQEAQRLLQKTEKYIVTKKSITDDPLLFNYVEQEKDASVRETMKIKMESEEINPVYFSLQQTISESQIKLSQLQATKEQLNAAIAKIQKELEQIQVELANKQHQDDILSRQVSTAQKTYNALIDKYEESRLTESSKIGESAVVISSRAIPPVEPVSPNKILNLAIAGVLGIMLGVFIAFFKEYWQSTANQSQSMKA
ncbi:MAG: hypothetical protein GXY91_06020 [Clostridia bacterium]|nr:hypothetical protein [Clostridia bacterium]